MHDALDIDATPPHLATAPAAARCCYRDARRLLHADAVDDWEANRTRSVRPA